MQTTYGNALDYHHDINQASFSDETAISKFKEHIAESHYDPRIDQENIDSIEENYFTFDETFDAREYELGVSILWSAILAFILDLCRQLASFCSKHITFNEYSVSYICWKFQSSILILSYRVLWKAGVFCSLEMFIWFWVHMISRNYRLYSNKENLANFRFLNICKSKDLLHPYIKIK